MSEKVQKRIIFGFLAFAVLYFVGMGIVSNKNEALLMRFHLTGYSSSEMLQNYQASYRADSGNGPTTIAVTVSPPGTGNSQDRLRTARELAAVSIENSARQLGISLPDGFENDIEIVLVDQQE